MLTELNVSAIVMIKTGRWSGLAVMRWLLGFDQRINVVALRRARLVLGWVTVCGSVVHLDMKLATGQLSLLPFMGWL